MLKKLSKSRKKNPNTKLANSRNKQPLQHRKEVKQQKQAKNLNKNNHHSSTLTLLNHHNLSHISHASQSSLLGLGHGNSIQAGQAGHGSHTGDKYGAKKAKSKNRQSSVSLIYREGKDAVVKQKQKEKDKDKDREKQKNKNVKDTKKQKSKKNSGLNQNSKTKKTISRISPQKLPERQKIFINNKKKPQQEIYERINLGIFNSKTNSEINFSNNSSVRQNNAHNVNLSSHLSPDHNASNFYLNSQIISSKNKKPLTIDCSDQYIISHYFSNSRIKNQDKKRTQAAIKIQKVFRGYLTRKMLEQYIQKEQQRLIKLAQKIKNSSSRQSGQISIGKIFENSKISHEVQRSQQVRNRSLTQNRQKQTSKKPSTDLFFDEHYEKSTNGLKQVESKQYKSSTQLIQEQEFYLVSLKNSRKQQHPIDHDALQQQSSIYGQAHDSISQYIPYQQKEIINQLQDQSEIIQKYTTEQRQRQSSGKKSIKNEEYYTYQQAKQLFSKNQKQKKDKEKDQISSSKQSEQLFKCTPVVSSYASRSSRQKIQQPMPTDFSDKKIGEFSSDISSKSKQLQYNQGSYNFNYNIRNETGEGEAEVYEHNMNFPRKKEPLIKNLAMNTIEYESSDDQKVMEEDIQNRKHPENNENIKKELNEYVRKGQKQLQSEQKLMDQKQKKQISQLKKVQKQKWSKIIQMLNLQIMENKEKSEENQKFMNIILEFSKKNKEQLEKSFTDILSMDDHETYQSSTHENLQHLHSFKKNKNQLENNTIDDRELYKQLSQESSIKNVQIKRKNNLILFKKPAKNSQPNKRINEEEQELSLPDPKFSHNSPPFEQDSSNFSLYNIKQQSYNISSSLLQDSQQKQQQQQQQIRDNLKKNLDLPFVRKKITNLNLNLHNCHAPTHQVPHSYPNHYPSSNKQNFTLLEKTQELKNFYRKNHAVYPIQQMIQIREKALEERQKHQLSRLNQDLSTNRLSHEQFISRLSQMQQKFQHERQQINKAKLQIFIGYRATHKLMHDSVKDAWYLGFKIPFSQSMKDFKSNNTGNLWFKDIIVDELKSFSNIHSNPSNEMRKNKKNNVTAQKIHRKGHPYLQLQIQLNDSSSQIKERQQNSLESISNKLQASQIKKEDLSISLPYEDSSLMKQNHEISQHSLYSEDISYNEGQIQLNHLQSANGKAYLFEDDINQQESEENSSKKNKKQQQWQGEGEGEQESVKGFRKMQGIKNQPINRMAIKIDLQNQRQALIIDPNQQKEVDNEIMRKISINPLKKQNRQQFQLELNIHNIKKYEVTGADQNTTSKSPRLLYNRNKNNVRSQIYKVELEQSSSQQEEVIFNEELDPEIKQVTQNQINNLIWEVTSQIYLNLHMRSKLCRNRNKMPDKIETNERMELISFLIQQIPSFQSLLPRINQKMTASRLELLKFMRVSFQDQDQFDLVSDQDEDHSSKSDGFQEIGKFEHILSAEICLSAMNKCLQEQELKESISYRQNYENGESIAIQKIKKSLEDKVPTQCIKKVIERQKLNKYNQMQKNDLRKQIKKVQYHCIFDSFNELIMKKRLKLSGYSGIGLNQLSLAMKNQQCRMIKQESQFKQILDQSVKQLRDLVGDEKTSNQKLVMQNYERLCQNDSQWIYYSDQALSFALQFVYMLEDQIFFEETALIFKKIKLR